MRAGLTHCLQLGNVYLLLHLISEDGKKVKAGGEKFGEREHSLLPHILTQCGLSSCHSAFPNLQADSPCACNRVISPVFALCVPQAHQYWAGVKSSWGLRMLELEQNLVAVPHPLCFAGDGIDPRRWTILQSSPKWVHISCPPHLCPFHPLGSLPSLAMILLKTPSFGVLKSYSSQSHLGEVPS